MESEGVWVLKVQRGSVFFGERGVLFLLVVSLP